MVQVWSATQINSHLSGGGTLTVTQGGTNVESCACGSEGFSSNKYYWETSVSSSAFLTSFSAFQGIANTNFSVADGAVIGSNAVIINQFSGGSFLYGNSHDQWLPTDNTTMQPISGDRIGHALDLVNNLYWVRDVTQNSGWYGSSPTSIGNPATATLGFYLAGTGFTILNFPIVPLVSVYANGDTATGYFIQASWLGSAPAGFAPFDQTVMYVPRSVHAPRMRRKLRRFARRIAPFKFTFTVLSQRSGASWPTKTVPSQLSRKRRRAWRALPRRPYPIVFTPTSSYIQGIDFRSTKAYATDPVNYDWALWSPATSYPQVTRQGNVVGFTQSDLNIAANNESVSNDPRIAGNVFVPLMGPNIGYSVTVILFGTGATYNNDGTISGTPNGAIYSFNPDSPDINTTVTAQGNFVSDFAGFTQGSVHCTRTDTALRVYFRKDVSPNPNRIEIILELGHFTYNGSAANLGPFSLQIFKAGVPQSIPAYTSAGRGNTWVPGGSNFTGLTNVTTAYFPQLGWGTRWRWNPTPRTVQRTGSSLLPSGLNLVPNFNSTIASAYGVVSCGVSGFSSGQATNNGTVTAYSSAYAPGVGNNKNPVGVNEGCTIGCIMGGTGGRPELGVVTEWGANYIVNGNAAALTALLVHGEVDGGIPWCFRDSTTNWAPINFYNLPNLAFYPGFLGFGSPQVDAPLVPEPSGLDGNTWGPDVNHTPLLSYIPYLLTGDPFFLENMQMMASWLIGANYFIRANGQLVMEFDPSSPRMPGFPRMWPSWRRATRGLAWALRTYTACYLATPASVPSWLQPQSYWKSVIDENQNQYDSFGTNYSTAHSTLPQYSSQIGALGFSCGFSFDEIFFLAYFAMAGSFALNQGKLSEWQPGIQWTMICPFAYGNGTGGAPKTWPAPYIMFMGPFGTDYNGMPNAFTQPADALTWIANNAMNSQTYNKDASWSLGGPNDFNPFFTNLWTSGTTYHCNSWMIEMRSGCPILPNVGDTISLTVSGSFAGSPVTVSHVVTASDVGNATTVGTLTYTAVNLASFLGNGGGSAGLNPVIDALVTQINTNASLSAAGIKASYTNTNVGPGSVSRQTNTDCSRIWISFNSDGTSVAGGPVIGNILLAGSYASVGPNSGSSVYIAPNGDGVNLGVHNVACFGRPVCYQAGASGVSTVAPSGTSPQVITGDLQWCYSPEFKSSPLIVPGGFSSVLPNIGYGGIYGITPMAPSYVDWLRAGVAGLQTAGLTGASGAYTTWKSIFDNYHSLNPSSYPSQFNFSMAP